MTMWIDALVKSTVLLAIVALAAHLLRRRAAALRHLVWSLGIVGLLALPLLSEVMPYRLYVLPPAPTEPGLGSATHEGAARTSRASTDRSATNRDAATRTTRANAEPAQPVSSRSDDASAERGAEVSATDSWVATLGAFGVLAAIWAAGVLVLVLRFAVGATVVYRVGRRAREVTDEDWLSVADRAAVALGVKLPLDIRLSDEVAMPFAFGFIHPTIVLPSSCAAWSAERREAVLLHEVAHLSRGDLAMNTLSHVARALYWFQPLAWFAAHRVRVEGERACDDAVLRTGSLPSDYAEHLLSIVRAVGNSVPSAALAMARKSDFEGRLLAILEPGVPRDRLTRLRGALAAGAFLLVVAPLAAMSPQPGAVEGRLLAQQPPAEPVPAAPSADRKADAKLPDPRTADARPQTALAAQPAQPQGSQGTTTGAVGALIETLADASATVRLAAVESLGKLGDPRAIAALGKALREDADARVREAAAHALGEIDDARAVPVLLETLKSESVAKVRAHIVRALGEIDDPSAVAGVSACAKDPNVEVRREVAKALGEFEDQAGAPALIGLLRDGDADVRRYAAEGLGNMKSMAALEPLAAATRDANPDVRRHALEALADLEDMRALPTFEAALKDADPLVRREAAEGFQKLDGLHQAPAGLIELLNDADRGVRRTAAEALGHIQDRAAVPALKRALSDADSGVRRQVAESLSDIGGPEAIQVLMTLLKDQDPEIRRIAAEALGSRRR